MSNLGISGSKANEYIKELPNKVENKPKSNDDIKKNIPEQNNNEPKDESKITAKSNIGKAQAEVKLFDDEPEIKTNFKSEREKSRAEKYLNNFSNGSFDPQRTTEDKFLNLRPLTDNAFRGKGNMNLLTPDASVKKIDISAFSGMKNTDDYKQALENVLSKNPNIPKDKVEEYVKNNLNSIAMNLADDIPYQGYTSLLGDANAMETLQKGSGVCTDIHATVTALRKTYGQEAYLAFTTGVDAAHVFTVFKEDGKWNIQNYGKVYQTEAKTIEELYNQYMPEQRKIQIYDVAKDGSIKTVSSDHLTETGRQERRFKAESGVGNYNPWVSENGITANNNEVSFSKNGFYAGIDPTDNKMGAAYYKKTGDASNGKIVGGAIQGQWDENQFGYERKSVDAKFEIEKKNDNAEKQTFGRTHFSVFGGVAKEPSKALYWQGVSDGSTPVGNTDPNVKIGFNLASNQSKLYGSSPLKFEAGYQTKLGATYTNFLSSPFAFSGIEQRAGRMYGDLNAEAKVVTGAFYQPNRDLTVRSGLATGLDLSKINGFKDIPKQAGNVFESDAYLDVIYSKNDFALNASTFVPLTDPSQFKLGFGAAYVPNDNFSLGVTYINEGILNDRIDYLKAGAEYNLNKNISFNANVTTPIFGDNQKMPTVEAGAKIRF
jgi:hypothetical protein